MAKQTETPRPITRPNGSTYCGACGRVMVPVNAGAAAIGFKHVATSKGLVARNLAEAAR